MTFQDDLNRALAAMLRDHCGLPLVASVTGFERYEATGGKCSTCRWTEVRVRVDYVTTDGDEDAYEYVGDMAALVRTLTDLTERDEDW